MLDLDDEGRWIPSLRRAFAFAISFAKVLLNLNYTYEYYFYHIRDTCLNLCISLCWGNKARLSHCLLVYIF